MSANRTRRMDLCTGSYQIEIDFQSQSMTIIPMVYEKSSLAGFGSSRKGHVA